MTPSLAGYVFVPATRLIPVGDGDLKGENFCAYRVIQADFNANPTSGLAPLTVAFTNTTTGDYTDFSWDFGDGGTERRSESHLHLHTIGYLHSDLDGQRARRIRHKNQACPGVSLYPGLSWFHWCTNNRHCSFDGDFY